MELLSWNRFVSRNLYVDAGLMGRSHTFEFKGASITISLPPTAAADRSEEYDEVARAVTWKGAPPVVWKYAVTGVDVHVDKGGDEDVPTEVLELPVNAFDVVPPATQRRLNEHCEHHRQIAEVAFEHWLSVLRWTTDNFAIGRPWVEGNYSGWSTYLHEKHSRRKVWIESSTVKVGRRLSVTLSHWTDAHGRLCRGEKSPIHIELLHDALHFTRNLGDHRRAIVDMAVACETYLRTRVLESLPSGVLPEVEAYVEDANISQFVSRFFPALLHGDDAKAYKKIKDELLSLIS